MKKYSLMALPVNNGSLFAKLLSEKDLEVHGMTRRSSSFNAGRIDHLHNN
jgi:GDP-D-mannose dehydratase